MSLNHEFIYFFLSLSNHFYNCGPFARIRSALRTNHIAGFVIVSAWKKIKSIFSSKIVFLARYNKIISSSHRAGAFSF